jgi:anti-anti-sigma regulatory factor
MRLKNITRIQAHKGFLDGRRKGETMAINFRILRQKEKDKLHLRLQGDFDGSSALELVNALKDAPDSADAIYIHTHDVSSMLPFGREVFINNYPDYKRVCGKMVFTGVWGVRLHPKKLKEVMH